MTLRALLRIITLIAALLAAMSHAWAQVSTLHTVEENGPRGQRINLVFLSEGYSAADLPNFAAHVDTARNFLFTREPWQQYRSYCNVYRIEIASNESGTDNGQSNPGGLKDTYFHSGFNTPSVPQLLTLTGTGNSRAYTLLNTHVPEYDVTVVIVNDVKYGGAGGSLAVASINGSSAAIVEHEIGHSFANLADEYDVEYPIYTPYETANSTQETTRALIKWNHWIDVSTPVPTPETAAYDDLAGLFEGCMYRQNDWYRPHNNSLMRNLNRPCGQVNREQFVLKYYQLLSPIDASAPASAPRDVTGFENLSFTVTPKAPSSGVSLLTSWKIDDVLQPGATADSFEVISDILGNGTHAVTATVRDPTAFVRLDAAGVLEDTVTWTLNLTNQLPPTLAAWRAAFGADMANPAGDGFVNLIKYALGVSPAQVITPAQRPFGTVTSLAGSDYLTLDVTRRTRRQDVDYIVEVSGDTATWNSGAGYTVTILDEGDHLVVRDAIARSAAAKRFIRLKITEY